jgi:hypothetical protein
MSFLQITIYPLKIKKVELFILYAIAAAAEALKDAKWTLKVKKIVVNGRHGRSGSADCKVFTNPPSFCMKGLGVSAHFLSLHV